jgi:hypothetical protein
MSGETAEKESEMMRAMGLPDQLSFGAKEQRHPQKKVKDDTTRGGQGQGKKAKIHAADGDDDDDEKEAVRPREAPPQPSAADQVFDPSPSAPPSVYGFSGSGSNGKHGDDDDDDDDDDDGPQPPADPRSLFPTSNHACMQGHTKLVSSITVDPSGARVVSGSMDGTIRLWDFGGRDLLYCTAFIPTLSLSLSVSLSLSLSLCSHLTLRIILSYAGMDSSLRAFREADVNEGATHQVRRGRH